MDVASDRRRMSSSHIRRLSLVPGQPLITPPRPFSPALSGGSASPPATSGDDSFHTRSPSASFTSTPSPRHVRRLTAGGSRRTSSISYITYPRTPDSPVYPSSPLAHIEESPSKDAVKPTPAEAAILQHTHSLQKHLVHRQFSPSLSEEPEPVEPERPKDALTLAEQHADLLSFIAQKESRCLELREQLVAHESELAGLKRKWERIVSRSAAFPGGPALGAPPPPSSVPVAATSAVAAVPDAVTDVIRGVNRMLSMGGLSAPNLASTGSTPRTHHHASDSSESSYTGSVADLSSPRDSAASSVTTAEDEITKMNGALLEEADEASRPSLSSSDTLTQAHVRSESPAPYQDTFGGLPTDLYAMPIDLQSPPRAASQSAGNSWVPQAFNKKWEELSKTDSITKSSKRASTLFAGMAKTSTSLFGQLSSALASPAPPTSSTVAAASTASPPSVSSPSARMSASGTHYFPLGHIPSGRTSSSLIDEDDEEISLDDSGPPTPSKAGILRPTLFAPSKRLSASPAQKSLPHRPASAAPEKSDDDDDWNW